GRVKEWSAESEDWVTLHPSAVIKDPTLVDGVTVTALLDAAVADDAVVRGLEKKQNPEILRIRHEGRVEALRQAVLSVLAARGLEVSETVRDAVLSCGDSTVLERWVQAAATADDANHLLRA
ncbi:MAG: hypothetical protein GY856_20120, partial [bacterium]|nr:hypothetical protein [bacterium]